MLRLVTVSGNTAYDAQGIPDVIDLQAQFLSYEGTGVADSGGNNLTTAGTGMEIVLAAYADATILGDVVSWASTALTVSPASTSDRKDIVVLVQGNTVPQIIKGTPCGTAHWGKNRNPSTNPPPAKPPMPEGSLLLVEIYVPAGCTSITSANLVDKAPILSAGGYGPPGGIGAQITEVSAAGSTPAVGLVGGGTAVTIRGAGFLGAAMVTNPVKFDGVSATGVVIVGDDEITCDSPAHVLGTIDVTVTTPSGTSAKGPSDQFTYQGLPAVTSVSPATGDAGSTVVVNGTGFVGSGDALFGANPGNVLWVNDAGTQLVASVPPGTGTVDIVVSTPLGTSTPVMADEFAYLGVSTGTTSIDTFTDLQGFYLNTPVSGSPFFPRDGMGRWRAFSRKLVHDVVFLGDSIPEGMVDAPAGGWSDFVDQVAANLGTVLGPGIRCLWRCNPSGTYGQVGHEEWTFSGTWDGSLAGGFVGRIATSSAADVAPFGEGYQESGATNIITWTNPFDTAVQCVDILGIDVAAATLGSYSINGGAWTNVATGLGSNLDYRVSVPNISIPPGGTFALRCADSTGTAKTAAFYAIEPYWIPTGRTATSTEVDEGYIVHNLGRNSAALSAATALGTSVSCPGFYRPTSGSTSGNKGLDVLDQISPTLIVSMFFNDAGFAALELAASHAAGTPVTSFTVNTGGLLSGAGKSIPSGTHISMANGDVVTLSSAISPHDTTIHITSFTPTGAGWSSGDIITCSDTTAWTTALEALMTHCASYSDFLLVNDYEAGYTNSLTPGIFNEQPTYRAATQAVGVAYGVPVLDLYVYFATALGVTGAPPNTTNPMNVYLSDELHLAQNGHNAVAAAITHALGPPGGNAASSTNTHDDLFNSMALL